MNAVDEKTGMVTLREATTEARALIEDRTRLSEELKLREERLAELLAPSETALRARTEYLDEVMRDELSRAEQQVLKLAEEVARIARNLNDGVMQMPSRLTEAVFQRSNYRARRRAHPRRGTGRRARVPIRAAHPRAEPGGDRAIGGSAAALSGRIRFDATRGLGPRRGEGGCAGQRRCASTGPARIVPAEGRFSSEQLRDAIVRGAGDLGVIRAAVSRLVERAVPGTERLRLPVRDVGPER